MPPGRMRAMNPDLMKKLDEEKAAFAAHGEAQPPPPADGRSKTSAKNGEGHKETDWKLAAAEFVARTGRAVEWRREGFYVYEPKKGAYRSRTDKELGAMVSAILPMDLPNGQVVKCSANAERNILVALRAGERLDLVPSCFLSTGKSAGGWVAMSNGLLDIEAAADAAAREEPSPGLLPFTPDFFSTFSRPFPWDPEAVCPRWQKFLEEVAPDPQNRTMLQMLAGLLLVEDTRYQVFFDLYGTGANGKGVYKETLQKLIGLENICRVPLPDFTEKFVVGELTQKRVNFVGDAETVDGSRKFSMGALEGILKEVSGGRDATMKLEPKGVQADTARRVKARCVFLTNSLTPWVDRTNAIWRRWRLIPFTVTIPEERMNLDLSEQIAADELPGIFRWAVVGLGALHKLRSFPQSDAGAKIIAEHRDACDRERAFLLEEYEVVPGGFVSSLQVYSEYRTWAAESGLKGILAEPNFRKNVFRVFGPEVKAGRKYFADGSANKQKRAYLNLAKRKQEIEI